MTSLNQINLTQHSQLPKVSQGPSKRYRCQHQTAAQGACLVLIRIPRTPPSYPALPASSSTRVVVNRCASIIPIATSRIPHSCLYLPTQYCVRAVCPARTPKMSMPRVCTRCLGSKAESEFSQGRKTCNACRVCKVLNDPAQVLADSCYRAAILSKDEKPERKRDRMHEAMRVTTRKPTRKTTSMCNTMQHFHKNM